MMCRGRRAFTLVEVLITLAVMSIALLGLVSVLVSGFKAQDKTSKSVVARSVASRVVDRTLRRLETSDAGQVETFWDADISTEALAWPEGTGHDMVGNTRFSYFVTGVEVKNGGSGAPFGTDDGGGSGNRLKMMTVTVRWADDGGRAKTGGGQQQVVVSCLVNRSQP